MRTRKTPASNDADRKSGYLHRSENCIALVESSDVLIPALDLNPDSDFDDFFGINSNSNSI